LAISTRLLPFVSVKGENGLKSGGGQGIAFGAVKSQIIEINK
jgi:hypothetical protein